MKYSTQNLYGIDPNILSEMTYKEALIACKNGAKYQLQALMQYGFMQRDEPLILAVNKAMEWCEAKLKELE